MGTRIKKSIVGGTTTYYIGDHFEKKGSTIIKYIFAGNLRVAQISGSTRSYFHKDHLGSSTVMTDASGSEIPSSSTEYMPFGSKRNTSTIPTNYLFTDQELDSENGLYNYNARVYDPVIGRFISPDTIVPQPLNPQSLNRYSYVLNNPLIYTDPSGHDEIYPCEDGSGDWCLPEVTSRPWWPPIPPGVFINMGVIMDMGAPNGSGPGTRYDLMELVKPHYPKNEVPDKESKLEGRDKQLLDCDTLDLFKQAFNEAMQYHDKHETGFYRKPGQQPKWGEPNEKYPFMIDLKGSIDAELSVHVHPFEKGEPAGKNSEGDEMYLFPYAPSGHRGYHPFWVKSWHWMDSGDKGYAWRFQNTYHYIILPDSTVVRYDYRGINNNFGKIMSLMKKQGCKKKS